MIYDSELPYHTELMGFLRAHFPEARMEEQRGASRPDISIENIAIEVKGPTLPVALQSIADKCMRYALHYEHLLIVLYDVRVTNAYYQEWLMALKRTHPHVRIVRHDPRAYLGGQRYGRS